MKMMEDKATQTINYDYKPQDDEEKKFYKEFISSYEEEFNDYELSDEEREIELQKAHENVVDKSYDEFEELKKEFFWLVERYCNLARDDFESIKIYEDEDELQDKPVWKVKYEKLRNLESYIDLIKEGPYEDLKDLLNLQIIKNFLFAIYRK